MEIKGIVKNGVIVLEEGHSLAEGTQVTVAYPAAMQVPEFTGTRRIQLPIVKTGRPGTLKLTNEMIAEIFDEEDAAPRE